MATKMIRGLEHLPYKDRLRMLGALHAREHKALVGPYSSLPVSERGVYRKAGEGLFIRACSDRTRGNGFKLEEGIFRLDMRKKFFTVSVMRHWNRLPKEVEDAPSLEAFKARLDVALGSLVWWLVTLHIAGGLKLDDRCPFQPRPLCLDKHFHWLSTSR